MGLVHFVTGKNSQNPLIPNEIIRILHHLYVQASADPKEVTRLCCKAGLCPLVLARTRLTFKAAS